MTAKRGNNAVKVAIIGTLATIIITIMGILGSTIILFQPIPLLTMTPTPLQLEATWTPTSTYQQPLSIEEQLIQIDQSLKQSLTAGIAYNAPSTMRLDESATIELLLNPAISPEALATQVTESGNVVKASIEITSRMKAVLKASEQDAFDIQPLHDSEEQLVSGTETTKWSWFVTAKRLDCTGLQLLFIVL
jgi:hypothetical protein